MIIGTEGRQQLGEEQSGNKVFRDFLPLLSVFIVQKIQKSLLQS